MNLLEALKMTCKDASYLHEKKKEGKLSFTETIGLRVHLLYCSLCRLFFKQLDTLGEYTHRFSQSDKTMTPLDSSTKERMKQSLAEELRK